MITDSKIDGPSELCIRSYRAGDLDSLYDICVQTGHNGKDARGVYATDELLGDLYAAPYAVLEPESAFVLDDGGRAVGYVIGTKDTRRFVGAFREHWLPRMAERYPNPVDEPTTASEKLIWLIQHPEHLLVDELLDQYPAHLHIDLLDDYQGRGFGKQLMNTFLDHLAASAVPGVHLGVSADNATAIAFYDRLGFTRVLIPRLGPGAVLLVRRTS